METTRRGGLTCPPERYRSARLQPPRAIKSKTKKYELHQRAVITVAYKYL